MYENIITLTSNVCSYRSYELNSFTAMFFKYNGGAGWLWWVLEGHASLEQ